MYKTHKQYEHVQNVQNVQNESTTGVHKAQHKAIAMLLSLSSSQILMQLVLALAREAWEGNHIADVVHTSSEKHESLEAQTPSSVRHRSESAQV